MQHHGDQGLGLGLKKLRSLLIGSSKIVDMEMRFYEVLVRKDWFVKYVDLYKMRTWGVGFSV